MKNLFTIAFGTLALLVSACSNPSSTPPAITTVSASPEASPAASAPFDELASGRKIYEHNCAACHKEDGRGGEMTIEGKTIEPDDLTSAKIVAFSDEKLIGYVYNGVEDEGMPAFKDRLTEAQIREVVSYVRRGIQNRPTTVAPANGARQLLR